MSEHTRDQPSLAEAVRSSNELLLSMQQHRDEIGKIHDKISFVEQQHGLGYVNPWSLVAFTGPKPVSLLGAFYGTDDIREIRDRMEEEPGDIVSEWQQLHEQAIYDFDVEIIKKRAPYTNTEPVVNLPAASEASRILGAAQAISYLFRYRKGAIPDTTFQHIAEVCGIKNAERDDIIRILACDSSIVYTRTVSNAILHASLRHPESITGKAVRSEDGLMQADLFGAREYTLEAAQEMLEAAVTRGNYNRLQLYEVLRTQLPDIAAGLEAGDAFAEDLTRWLGNRVLLRSKSLEDVRPPAFVHEFIPQQAFAGLISAKIAEIKDYERNPQLPHRTAADVALIGSGAPDYDAVAAGVKHLEESLAKIS